MSLLYILERFAQKTGIPCVSYNGIPADAETKAYALSFINEGAEELYDAADHVGSLEELVISLNSKTQVTLPSFVGKPRAIREMDTYHPWKLSTMRPRYHINSWPEENFRNFRDKGVVAIARDITNTAPPTAVVTEVENPPLQITIVGATANAGRVSETIVMDELEKTFTKSFVEYESFSKDRLNDVNVLLKDVDGKELAMIYNYELSSSYRIFDVSEFDMLQINKNVTYEILYKKKFKMFRNDSDEFQIPGYDNAIINKAIQLFAEDKGDLTKAALYDAKAQRTSERKALDELKGKDMRIEFQPHKHALLGKGTKFRR